MTGHIIDIPDIDAAFEEMLKFAKDYGDRHDLHPRTEGGNTTEGAAIADAMLKFVGVTDSREFTEMVDGLTMRSRLVIVNAFAMGKAGLADAEAINRVMKLTLGSIWMTAFTTGVQIGRKFPKA
jgi:hypothetical protein